jgi:hypothetical protein
MNFPGTNSKEGGAMNNKAKLAEDLVSSLKLSLLFDRCAHAPLELACSIPSG